MNAIAVGEHLTSLERLRTPWRWDDFSKESPEDAELKIRAAHELGVAAVLFSRPQIDRRFVDMATYIAHAWDLENTHFLLIGNGGYPTGYVFLRELAGVSVYNKRLHPQHGHIVIGSYDDQTSGAVRLKSGIDFDPAGRHIIAYDDIEESGNSMEWIGRVTDPNSCTDLGPNVTGQARSFSSILLGARPSAKDLPNKLIGFALPYGWNCGGGLNTGIHFRLTPELCLDKTQKSELKESIEQLLTTLGDRAIVTMDEINWI